MKKTVRKTNYSGTVIAPPSKSDGHRLLICAALCSGTSIIHGISESEDMGATLDCISALGARWERHGDTVTVTGADPKARPSAVFPCRESGSTLRFFIPIALLSENEALFKGSPTLLSRPLDVYGEICSGQGLCMEFTDEGLLVCGGMSGGYFKVRGDISSQFISGLMFALPLLREYSVIELIPPVASETYIYMTADALRKFGIKVEFSENKIIIEGGQTYKPTEVSAEGDWSNGAFFLALSALGNDVDVEGLDRMTLQGDSVIIKLLGRLARTRPTFNIESFPDLAPIIMAVSSAMNGVTLTGTDRLKIKESDRGAAMAEELSKFGVNVTVGDNIITVDAPLELLTPKEPVCGHNDHRIVMACAILMTLTGGEIEGAEAVNKSYPDFFNDLYALEAGDTN